MSDPTQNLDAAGWHMPAPTSTTPAYQPPALAIRATFTLGDASQEVVIEADQLPADPGAFVTEVLSAMSREFPGSVTAVHTAGAPFDSTQEATR